MDELARGMFVVLLAAVGCALVVGGLCTPGAGRWRDGERWVSLRQTLFYLRGHGEVPGGLQVYRGAALFRRVWLWRHDYGPRHLQALGFDAKQAQALQGQVTGLFRLRLRGQDGEVLDGTFSGKRFRFSGARLQQQGFVQPTPRQWRRASEEG